MKKKVMFIIWALEVGGAERLLVKLAQKIPKDRYDVSVVCISREGVWADELKQAGIPVICTHKRTGFDPSILLKLIQLIRKEKPDIVNTTLWTADLWGRLAAIIAGVKHIIVTEQNVDVWKRWYHISIDRMLFKYTHYAICVSNEVVNYYRNTVGLQAEQLVMIPNAIDVSLFDDDAVQDDLRDSLGIKADEFIFTCSARLHEQKAHEVLIEAVKLVHDIPLTNFQVLLVGEGPRRDELQNMVEKLGLSNRILFLGLRQDIPNILLQSNSFVLSSDYEGLSLAILEAMAARLPIVATTVGGNAQIVEDGETGWLVPPQNPSLLADAMMKVLNDPQRAKQMGVAGRDRVEGVYDIQSVTQQIVALFESCWR
jgi:sugar transferase (PEP-CTERM/EpsH1 system associated)